LLSAQGREAFARHCQLQHNGEQQPFTKTLDTTTTSDGVKLEPVATGDGVEEAVPAVAATSGIEKTDGKLYACIECDKQVSGGERV
jgi:hypothetical protein